jgi:serine/threonine protein kinase
MIIGKKYRVLKALTKTTLSMVYECEHIIKKERVIVKMDLQKKLIEREAWIYLYLKDSSIHIPTLKATGIHEGSAYMVLSPLREGILTYEGDISYITFFRELFSFHEKGLVHRDIKPQNFLIGYDDALYLIDFGLSCFHTEEPMRSFVGNKRYASDVCFEESYVYQYKDDVKSMIYMLLDLTFGYMPWDKCNLPRKDIKLRDFYPRHILVELYDLCGEGFRYSIFFDRLSGGIDSCQPKGEGEVSRV